MEQGHLTSYQQKLRDPRWQKKRLEIFERDDWACLQCSSTEKTLNVHHRIYLDGHEPWDVPSDIILETLCETCHEKETTERREAEKHLITTLRALGLPWYALHVFADKIMQAFPPLPRQQALEMIAVVMAYLPKIAQAMDLIPQGNDIEDTTPTQAV